MSQTQPPHHPQQPQSSQPQPSLVDNIQTVMSQCGVERYKAIQLLQKTDGNVVSAIVDGIGHADKNEHGGENIRSSVDVTVNTPESKIAELRQILDEKDLIFRNLMS
jgi:hypothetical protein